MHLLCIIEPGIDFHIDSYKKFNKWYSQLPSLMLSIKKRVKSSCGRLSVIAQDT